MQALNNQALDCTHFLIIDGSVYVISEKKGNIALVQPSVIKVELSTVTQVMLTMIASSFGFEIKMRPLQIQVQQPDSEKKDDSTTIKPRLM